MSNSKKAKAAPERATPVLAKAKGSDAEKIDAAHTSVVAMKASPDWASAPATVQTAVTGWSAAADALSTNALLIKNLRDQLAVAEAAQRTLRRKWSDATRGVLGAVTVWCDGSADMVQRLGFAVLRHLGIGPLAVPTDLSTSSGPNPNEATVKWPRVNAHHGFLVQHATDTANTATYSVPAPSTKARFTLTGAPSATVVHFRVAAIDPSSKTGMTGWSTWIAATVK